MPKPLVIEVGGEPQGIIVPVSGGVRFVAVKLPVFPIDGQVFASADAARKAAQSLVLPKKTFAQRTAA